MVTTSQQSESNQECQEQEPFASSLGYDYALLGLKAHESRVGVIRKAAQEVATRINQEAEDTREQDAMLTQLAASTYRLLDPRRRSQAIERVQLCLYSEDDWERRKGSRKSLVPMRNDNGKRASQQTGKRLVVAELVEEQRL